MKAPLPFSATRSPNLRWEGISSDRPGRLCFHRFHRSALAVSPSSTCGTLTRHWTNRIANFVAIKKGAAELIRCVDPKSGTSSLTKLKSSNHSPGGPVFVASHSPSQLHAAPAVAPP
jgi:hypothetical protein